jgi:PAS domain S-box-containing protein
LAVLADDPLDVPFACLYVLDETRERARLASSYGRIPEELRPANIILAAGNSPWPVAEAVVQDKNQVVQLPDGAGSIPSSLWRDRVSQAIVLPVHGQGSSTSVALLIAGVSRRCALDDGYRGFFDLIAGQFAAALANAQAYEAQRLRSEGLAAIDRAKTAFFSNVSHEFRTPLTLMLGPIVESIAHPGTPPAVREQLELAHRNSLRLLKLVNSLLDFSRLEAGRVQASFEPLDLGSITRDLASIFRSAIERAGLRFRVECEDFGEPVYIDRDMWEKIVLNLLSNALKFTLAGDITVRLRREAADALLEVADTGIGIPEHEIPRLFERFHRVEGSVGRTQEGSGIGLALVQELVKLHGGTVEVASKGGQGTLFRVRIGFGTAHLPAQRIRAPRELASTATEAQAYVQEALKWLPQASDETSPRLPAMIESAAIQGERFGSTAGAKIILADDNADMRNYLRELLSPLYAVEAVADGEQALAAAARELPDLILSDVMMPRLDGFGLLKAVRDDEALRNLPIILLSARAGEESRIEGLDAGADDYLIKPFSARELLARVGALLEREKIRRESRDQEQTLHQAAHRRTAQFETLLNKAPVGIYLVGADFKIRDINPAALSAFGDIPGVIGRDFDEVMRILCPADRADDIVRRFRRTLETGESYSIPEHKKERADLGITQYYEWEIHRITLPDHGFGVVCYFRDISAHVQVRTALETADRQKDEFLAMLAHELRNPLAPIRNAMELLTRMIPADSRIQSALGMTKRQVAQLSRLVDDLLDVSRITQRRIELKRCAIDLPSIIAHAVETVEPLLKEKQLDISITTSSYHPLHVNGDAARLTQCVVNVLTNAAKYTDSGGRIRVQTSARNSAAVIEIADNGAGIAPELLPRIFDLFVQGDRTLDRSQGGLGIGLSVVKRLVEMHDGEVVARSDGLGRGSVFEIRLPLVERPGGNAAEAGKLRPTPTRLLIVDDNQDAADSLAMLLELEGHEVSAVYTAQAALDEVRRFNPSVVLLDIGLPEMDGYEVARRMRAIPELRDVRLVAVTGYGQAEDRRRTRDAGFDDHLTKPVDLSNVERTIAGLSNTHNE